jgi:predicted transcriptional regulator
MTTTTTIRLPEDLKERIARAAERAGKTTHSFIVEAIAEKAELEEQRAGFDAEANARFAKIVESGKTIPWTEMRHYLEERLAGKQIPRPVAKTRE